MEAVHRETYYLHPGYIYISRQQETIQTVLGSCVAVCLWDQSQKCGGHPEGVTGENLGDQNVKIAREILKNKGISIIAEDAGGSVGRKIAFDVITGHVAVLKVHKVRKEDWHTEEYMKTPYEGR